MSSKENGRAQKEVPNDEMFVLYPSRVDHFSRGLFYFIRYAKNEKEVVLDTRMANCQPYTLSFVTKDVQINIRKYY